MIYMAWILVLILLSYGFNHYLEQQNNPNQSLNTYAENNNTLIRLKQNRQGQYLVNGKINQQSVTFLLDTGATLVSIPASVAQHLNLIKGYALQSKTANGTIQVFSTLLDSVSIGDLKQHNIKAVINPYMKGDEVLLGMSFLKHLEMTQKDQQLILKN